ncbi:hypothetical protein C8Q80DRAFT_120658 [Daedaleopsis nitida]|nr:hypothetical protein C8Q80DRAFT_120658 [Daedaleopsis nitida]
MSLSISSRIASRIVSSSPSGLINIARLHVSSLYTTLLSQIDGATESSRPSRASPVKEVSREASPSPTKVEPTKAESSSTKPKAESSFVRDEPPHLGRKAVEVRAKPRRLGTREQDLRRHVNARKLLDSLSSVQSRRD